MTTTPLSIKSIRLTSIVILAVWMTCWAFILHFVLNFSWQVALADTLISNGLLAVGCVTVSNILGFYQPKNEKLLFVLLLTLVLTFLTIYLTKFGLGYLFALEKTTLLFADFSIPFRFMIIFLCLSWCALTNVLWYRLEEQSETQNRLLIAQNLAKEAELNKLRHQLQPHFLFNSLNSVYALTIVNPAGVGTMILKLAAFLRGNLKRDDEVWVNVAEEMEYIQLYLDIEKIRFSHRLSFDIEIDEDTLALSLPGTLLQPIVENAIKFGLYNTATAIVIKITVKLLDHTLVITVENPFDATGSSESGTGFGLSSVRRRLHLMFADQHLLKTETRNNNLYITTLKIPQ